MTETELCNMALGLLGHDRVIETDFRSDTSTEAARCRLHFDAARKRLLSGNDWQFAEEPVTLAFPRRHTGGYDPATLPGDCLNIVRAHDPRDKDHRTPWAGTGRGSVRCLCDAATIVYIRDVQDLAQWPQRPLDALAAELAASLAFAMTGSADKAKAARQDALATLARAALWNARQFNKLMPCRDRYAHGRH